jgi:phage terminase small subunit
VPFYCRKGGGGVTPRQEKFCIEYLIDLNATQAAIRAGYSKKTAEALASRLLRNVNIRSRIKELQDKVFEDGMMSAAEALWRLSKAGRGELKEEVVVTEGIGDGFSEAKIIKKQISARDQIKALELMGKRHDLFSSDTKIEMVPVIITGECEIHE